MEDFTQLVNRQILINAGLNPDEYEVGRDNVTIVKKPTRVQPTMDAGLPQPKVSSPLQTGLREAVHAVPAAVAAGYGAAKGAAIGSAFAPPFGTLGGAVIGGLAGGIGASLLTDVVEQQVAPEYYEQRMSDVAANPWSAAAGRLAAIPAGGVGPSALGALRGVSAIGTAASRIPERGITGAIRTLSIPEQAAAANIGIGTTLGAGMAVGPQIAQGKGLGEILTSPELAEGVIGGALFNKPNAIGRRMGFTPDVLNVNAIDPEQNKVRLAAVMQELQKQQLAQQKKEKELSDKIAKEVKKIAKSKKANDLQFQLTPEQPVLSPEILQAAVAPQMQRRVLPMSAEQAAQQTVLSREDLPSIQGAAERAARSRTEQETIEALRTRGLAADLAPETLAEFAAFAKSKGINVEADPNWDTKGSTFLKQGLQNIAVKINPKTATLDTPFHEGAGHAYFQFLKDSPYASDKRLIAQAEQLFGNSDEFRRYNEARQAVGKQPVDVEEFMAHEVGMETLRRHIETDGDWKIWWKDTKAQLKQALGRATDADVKRIISYKWLNDPAFSQYFGTQYKGAGTAAAVKAPIESIKQEEPDRAADFQKAREEEWAQQIREAGVARSLQDFEMQSQVARPEQRAVSDADNTTRMTPPDEDVNTRWEDAEQDRLERRNQPADEGLPADLTPDYRPIRVKAKDGTTYDAYFNDKFYDMGQMGKLASIAKITPEGAVTHTALRPGDTYEELTRRDQPQREGLAGQRQREQIKANKERYRRELEEIRGGKTPRSNYVTPPDERRQIKNWSPEFDKKVTKLANTSIDKIEGRVRAGQKTKDFSAFNREDKRDIVNEVKNAIADSGIDEDNLSFTVFRRTYDVIRRKLGEFAAQPKTVSLQKPVGESGRTLEDVIPVAEETTAVSKLEEAGVTDKTELPTKTPVRQTTRETVATVERTPEESIAQLEGFLDTIRDEEPEKYDLFKPVVDELIARLQAMPPDQIVDMQQLQRDMMKSIRRNQDVTEGLQRDFMLSAERATRTLPNRFNAAQALGTIKNRVPPVEWELLKQAGIETALPASMTRDELMTWLQTNGPRVEVHSYGMEGKISEARREYDRMTHEWFDSLSSDKQRQARNFSGNSESLKEHGWTPKEIATHQKYYDLKRSMSSRGSAENPRATSAYESVSAFPVSEPMPEWTTSKEGKNVQRVDVRIPVKKVKKTTQNGPFSGEVEVFEPIWHGDIPQGGPHDYDNTLGWAMIQYKTGPKGEKIAFIAEAQSRWGQEKREYWKKYEEALKSLRKDNPTRSEELLQKQAHNIAEHEVRQYRPGMDSPLDTDYNRLILKAAIEQARKEGATHIVVSDAETAMMTEGHDVIAGHTYRPDTAEYKTKEQALNAASRWIDNNPEHAVVIDEEYLPVMYRETPDGGYFWEMHKASNQISQEPGMRFNYDTALPRIAQELTGGKGERVSLGEHKNAFENAMRGEYNDSGVEMHDPVYSRPRQNLIFRNPDDTPKTDVTGTMFPLPEARTEPYSIAERRNQPANEGLARSTYERFVVPVKDRLITAEVDRLAKQSPVAAKAAGEFYREYRNNLGMFEQSLLRTVKKLRDAKNLKEWITDNNPDYEAVVAYRDAMTDGEVPEKELTPVQKQINDAITENLTLTYNEREGRKKLGDLPGLARGTGQIENYLPHVMARDVIKTLTERPKSEEAEQLRQAFIRYRTTTRGQDLESAIADWKTLRRGFTLQEGGDIASQFNAIDKAAGLGLPKEMRERHLLDRMARFNRRFARRVAYYDTIGSNKAASDAFFSAEEGVASSVAGKNVIEDIFGVREYNEALRTAVAGVVRAAMLGPLTGAKDVTAGQFLGLQHMDWDQIIPAKIHSYKNWKQSFESAISSGVIRDNIGAIEMGEAGVEQVTNILTRARDIINKAQGRQLLENTARTLSFGEGQYLALDAAKALKTGRLTAQKRKFLEDFMPDWQSLRDNPATPQQINEAAARFVESVQGTYDLRGLPNVAMKGSLALPLSLQRWSIEKFNNFEKFVVQPALDGNYRPLLMSTLGLIIGGEAVNQLVELATDRKERTPKYKEIAESEDKVRMIAYKAAALATMSGYAGILGDLAKTSMDFYNKNRVQSWSNPFIEAVSTGLEDIGFVVEAMREGDTPNVVEILNLVMSDYVQAYRIAAAQLSDEKQQQNERMDKSRDLRVFEMGQGYPMRSTDMRRPNPLINQDVRDFKQSESVREAAAMVPELVQNAIEESKDADGRINIDILQSKLQSLKRNSYQTMPAPSRNPVKFAQFRNWLERVQGPEAAQERTVDYMTRNAVNRAKSSLIPSP